LKNKSSKVVKKVVVKKPSSKKPTEKILKKKTIQRKSKQTVTTGKVNPMSEFHALSEEDKLVALTDIEKNKEYKGARTIRQRMQALNSFTREKKIEFLKHLASHGVATYAAKEVGISHVTVFKHRREDPRFAEVWEEAIKVAKGVVEHEVHRRGVLGIDKPLHHKGVLTGDKIKEFSDTLLMFQAKKLMPDDYRENKSTNIIINNTTEGMTDAELEKFIKEGSEVKTIEGESEVVEE